MSARPHTHHTHRYHFELCNIRIRVPDDWYGIQCSVFSLLALPALNAFNHFLSAATLSHVCQFREFKWKTPMPRKWSETSDVWKFILIEFNRCEVKINRLFDCLLFGRWQNANTHTYASHIRTQTDNIVSFCSLEIILIHSVDRLCNFATW